MSRPMRSQALTRMTKITLRGCGAAETRRTCARSYLEINLELTIITKAFCLMKIYKSILRFCQQQATLSSSLS